MDALATSTPRTSVTDKMLISDDMSQVENKADSLNTSADSHTSEISFSFTPVTSKPVSKVVDKDSHSDMQKSETQSTKDIACPTVKLDNSMEVSDLNNSLNSQDTHTADSESLKLNFGPKRENKEWYKKDFYITNTPILQRRKSSESSDKEESPRAEKQRAHTEEKVRIITFIYLLNYCLFIVVQTTFNSF